MDSTSRRRVSYLWGSRVEAVSTACVHDEYDDDVDNSYDDDNDDDDGSDANSHDDVRNYNDEYDDDYMACSERRRWIGYMDDVDRNDDDIDDYDDDYDDVVMMM